MKHTVAIFLALSACVHADRQTVTSSDNDATAVAVEGPAQCTNCGISPSDKGDKTYDPEATY